MAGLIGFKDVKIPEARFTTGLLGNGQNQSKATMVIISC